MGKRKKQSLLWQKTSEFYILFHNVLPLRCRDPPGELDYYHVQMMWKVFYSNVDSVMWQYTNYKFLYEFYNCQPMNNILPSQQQSSQFTTSVRVYYLITPYNITHKSHVKVTRIKEWFPSKESLDCSTNSPN